LADVTRSHFVAHKHQNVARRFLIDTPRANLWMPMGAGKTPTVLSLLDLLQLAGSNFFPALVIAPKRVAQVVWTGEQAKWDAFADLKVVRILGTADERLAALRGPKADVYVINYDNIEWLLKALGDRPWPFKIVIADESTRLKNFRLMGGGGARASALSQIAKHTGRWINLTGTPVTNGLKDLWGQNWFIDFGQRLGRSFTTFQNRWFIEEAYTHRIVPIGDAEEEIHEAMKDIALAFELEDCLPNVLEPFEVPVECELPPDARKLYDEMADEMFVQLGEDGIEAFNAMAKSTKLLQLASGAIYDGEKNVHHVHDAKIEALQEIAENTDENLLVAYHFKFHIPAIRKAFPKARVLESEKDIDDWNAGRIKILLAHPQSAGHGINLAKGGRNIVFFAHDWNLEYRQQIIERLGPARQAQLNTGLATRIFNLIARDTLDVDALDRTANKLTVQQALMRARSRR
jgi:SNF2 family DNA or RNA helicase